VTDQATAPADASAEAPASPQSVWAPLRHPLFRAFWIAVLASQIGTWMQNAGAAWLMTSLAASPALVALMQTATSLPTFLVGLPAGALADIVDRRRLLLLTQGWMLIAAIVLAALTLAGVVTAALLLVLTFAIGFGVALTGPAWQATSPYLVPPEELPGAVALNGVAVNVGRVVGPAIGGLLLAGAGAAAVFLTNAASFVGMLAVVFRWKPRPSERVLPAERLPGAMRAGLRYVRHSPPLQAVLVRTALFVSGASALFALLPVVARRELGLGSAGFGLLLAVLGVGAIGGASLLPRLRARLDPDLLVGSATVLFAGSLVALALAHDLAIAFPAMLVAGLAWIALMASLNVAAQTSAPRWVRARALASYLLVFQGGLALGSIVWGAVAATTRVSTALLAAAAFLGAGLLAAPRFRLRTSVKPDLTPYHWSEPLVSTEPGHDRGPVLVTVEYLVDPERAADFVAAMRELGRIRRRDGAYRWGLFRDVAEPDRYVETFLVESWVEHLRQHRRGTVADRQLLEHVHSFHRGPDRPVVTHLLSEARLAGALEPRPARGSFWRRPRPLEFE
jgi:MFS family permease